MQDKKTFYVTTPIFYPSGKFHIGTAYCEILTDSIKRYKQLMGYDTFMLTGLDEHGQKMQTVAEEKNLTPKQHVDNMAKDAKKLWELLNIDYDKFIRTTDEYHCKAVEKIVKKFLENGDVYKGKYEDWYCMPCEEYFTETQLVDGKCPECGREVKKMSEEAYFFNMKKYESWIKDFYKENPDFIVPESRKIEIIKNFIEPGLEDLCITRSSFDWGIKMPDDPKHVLYVWLDALTNYITALGYEGEDNSLFKKYWPADLHIVGKEIIRFHGIYWPIFLHALGIDLPKKIYAHSWIVMKDGKMSKSVGNVIYPEDLVSRYGVDATRYYLLKLMNFSQDSMFTPEDFVDKFNADLANDLGNLLNRTIGMTNKYFNGVINKNVKVRTDFDDDIEQTIKEQVVEVIKQMDEYHVANALNAIWQIIRRANKYIDETTPWVLAKSEDSEDKEKLMSVMFHLVDALSKVAIMIYPYMPETSDKMLEQLGVTVDEKSFNLVKEPTFLKDETKVIEKGIPLFVRLEKEEEIEYIKSKMKGK